MSKKGWILLGLLALVVVWMFTGNSEPAIEDGSTLVVDIQGAYVDGVVSPMLSLFAGPEQSLLQAVSRLRKAERDPRIETVLLRIRGVEMGWGQAEELRGRIAALGEAGKRTIALLEYEGYGNGSYYLASAAGHVAATPGGHNPFVGIAGEYLFYGGLMEKLGIEVEYERIGQYKSAVESYAHSKATDPNREMMRSMLGSVEKTFVGAIADSRGMTADEVREIIDGAPTSPTEMLDAGLIDQIAFYDELMESLGDPTTVDSATYDGVSPETVGFEPVSTLALIYGSGPVVTGSGDRTASGGRVMASETVAASIREAVENEDVSAIIFRVNSPGGSPLASDLILRELERAQEEGKPVVVSMSDYAASGGYYVAAGADSIVSYAATLTGSIGVFTIRPSFGGLYEKLGIGFESVTHGANADLLLVSDALTPEARGVLKRDVESIYSLFLDRVVDGRGMSRDAVHAIAQGRVWTGEQAVEIGLVDRIGGLRVAVEEAMELADLDPGADVGIIEYPRPKPLGQQLAELLGVRATASLAELPLPPALRQMLVTFEALPAGKPMLVMPGHITIH